MAFDFFAQCRVEFVVQKIGQLRDEFSAGF
jgi:hypothetical protein